MFQRIPARIMAIVVALAMVFGSAHTAWAAPKKASSLRSTSATASHTASSASRISARAALPEAGVLRLAQVQPTAPGFTAEERMELQQRQAQNKNLEQYKGGEAIVIGTTALVIILAVVLVIVLVD
jgi:hypothetical protein